MKDYLPLFLQESERQLAGIEDALSNAPPGGIADLDALFRFVHSFKGMAGTMGFRALMELSHRMEDLLGRRRAEKKPLSPEEVSLLLRAHDRMVRLRGEIEEGGDSEADFSDLLAAFSPREGSPGAKPEPTPRTAAAQAIPGALEVAVALDPEAPAPLARAYVILQRFRQIAPDLVCSPSEEEMGAGAPVRELLLTLPGVSRADAETLYGTLTDVAGLRFPEPARTPAPPPVTSPPLAAPAAQPGAGVPDALGLPDTVEISARLLDEFLEIVGDLTLVRSRLASLSQDEKSSPLAEEARRLGSLIRRLDDRVVSARLLPFALIVGRLRRFVREQADRMGKEVRLEVRGERIGLDKAVMLRLSGALLHLLRNALDHGVETPGERRAAGKAPSAEIVISLERERNALSLTVADDGRGVDLGAVRSRAVERGLASAEEAGGLPEDRVLEFLFAPGFSTREEAGELSGRGVGLDAVRSDLARLGGSVTLRSVWGRGATFLLRLPVSPAVAPVLLVEVGQTPLAFPVPSVEKTYEGVLREMRRDEEGRPLFRHGEELLPVRPLAERLGLASNPDPERFAIVAVSAKEGVRLFSVDRLVREEELFIKPFRGPWDRLGRLAGYSLLGDGRLVYVLDSSEL